MATTLNLDSHSPVSGNVEPSSPRWVVSARRSWWHSGVSAPLDAVFGRIDHDLALLSVDQTTAEHVRASSSEDAEA